MIRQFCQVITTAKLNVPSPCSPMMLPMAIHAKNGANAAVKTKTTEQTRFPPFQRSDGADVGALETACFSIRFLYDSVFHFRFLHAY